MRTFYLGLAGVVGLALSFNTYAASCNPKAQTHQQRLVNIMQSMSIGGSAVGRTPTPDDEQFVLCMLSEKEDRDAFEQRVQAMRARDAARPAQEAAQRQQEQQRAQAWQRQHDADVAKSQAAFAGREAKWQACGNLAGNRQSYARNDFLMSCKSAWEQAPNANCGANTIPCGGQCVDPNTQGTHVPSCVNGQIQWARD
jgi:hypothetical protein